jgi:hypothetical protein
MGSMARQKDAMLGLTAYVCLSPHEMRFQESSRVGPCRFLGGRTLAARLLLT